MNTETLVEKYGTGIATILSENIDRVVRKIMTEHGFNDHAHMSEKGYDIIINHLPGAVNVRLVKDVKGKSVSIKFGIK